MALYISPDIFQKELQGTLVLLDLRSECYFAFDSVATLMWKALLITNSQDEALETLRDKLVVNEPRLATDLEAFRGRCLERGWMQESEPKPRILPPTLPIARRRQGFLFLRAWLSLFRTVQKLSAAGLGCVYKEYTAEPISITTSENTDALLSRALAAFAMAENFFIIRNAPKDCVPRSLALFKFLRSLGLTVEHCIGVRAFPFQAHAWVEYRDCVLHDNPSRKLEFTTLARSSA